MLITSTTQRYPNKILKTFLNKDFIPFAIGVNDTGGAPIAANIFTNF
jgi:hypothetical protein